MHLDDDGSVVDAHSVYDQLTRRGKEGFKQHAMTSIAADSWEE
jgi:hypothetical protein